METLHPIISPSIWTTIASGKLPEEHGVVDFYATAADVRVPRLWEIAANAGLATGVLGYLVTWPPHEMPNLAFLVPGWLASDSQTIPPSLSFLKTLELDAKSGKDLSLWDLSRSALSALRYGSSLHTFTLAAQLIASKRIWPRDERMQALLARRLKLALSADVFAHLLRTRRLHFAVFYNSSLDAVEHLFFKYYRPELWPEISGDEIRRYGTAIPAMYAETDRALRVITQAMAPHATLLVVSDHGQQPARRNGRPWFSIQASKLLDLLGVTGLVRATNVGDALRLSSR
ncbi:MAG: hypothetical protein D6815_12485, partial [Candidatus Dadabacteria bacterium]